jgi:hypothetical protein
LGTCLQATYAVNPPVDRIEHIVAGDRFGLREAFSLEVKPLRIEHGQGDAEAASDLLRGDHTRIDLEADGLSRLNAHSENIGSDRAKSKSSFREGLACAPIPRKFVPMASRALDEIGPDEPMTLREACDLVFEATCRRHRSGRKRQKADW